VVLHDVSQAAYFDKLAVTDGYGISNRIFAIDSVKSAISENDVSFTKSNNKIS
jgi:hypothetical protein